MVVRSGRRVRTGPFVLHCLYRTDTAPSRFAFALPRSVGAAVHRNRVRRRVQGLIHEWDGLGVLTPGADVVVRVLPGATALDHSEIRRRLGPALARVQVLTTAPGPTVGGSTVEEPTG